MTPVETETEAITALQELLDERQRYEAWLCTLEQRKGATAPHVYDRVYGDYAGRLERVIQRLSERTEQLRSTVEVLQSRLNALCAREADRIDAREEAELRAAVGEYADEEWVRLRDDADREIAGIAEGRRSVEGEVAELQRIVDLTRAPGAMGCASAPSVGDSNLAPPVPELSSALPSPTTSQRIEPSVATPAAARRPGSTQQRMQPPPLPPDDEAIPDDTASIPAREQEKTLRCPECGTMNYATEWYCERCGGELATF